MIKIEDLLKNLSKIVARWLIQYQKCDMFKIQLVKYIYFSIIKQKSAWMRLIPVNWEFIH